MISSSRINTETTLQHDIPVILFSGNYRGTGTQGAFYIATDGSQFRGDGTFETTEQTRLVVAENWFKVLK